MTSLSSNTHNPTSAVSSWQWLRQCIQAATANPPRPAAPTQPRYKLCAEDSPALADWRQCLQDGNAVLATGHYSAALQAYSRARCLCQQRLSAGEDIPQWLPAYGATIANLAHCWAMIGLRTQAMTALNEALETLYHYDDRVAGATAQQVQYRLLTQWLQLERCRLHPTG